MGAVLAKFRKEKTTTEVLEKLEERIKQIEKYSFSTQERKKRLVGNFLAVSVGMYVIAFLAFYFFYFPPTWSKRFIYSLPLLIFPVIIAFLRTALAWYFQRKLNKNSTQLSALRAEKKKILEQVMDKETYKVAVDLLARFGDKTNGTKPTPSYTRLVGTTPVRPNQAMLPSTSSQQSSFARRSLNISLADTPRQPPKTAAASGGFGSTDYDLSRQLTISPALGGQEMRRRTPFPIVNQQNKTVFERIVDVLIGDGPQDRFAMICKKCFAHNGMALKEEFDFATFRCAFCNTLNPSRKARPIAPPLPLSHAGTPRGYTGRSSSDSTSASSDNDSDVDNFPRSVPIVKMTESTSPEAEENVIEPVAAGEDDEKNQEEEEEKKEMKNADETKKDV